MNKTKNLFLVLLVTNFLLISCSQAPAPTPSSHANEKAVSWNNQKTGHEISRKNTTYSSSAGVKVKIIKVASRCIGCGKCMGIDPAHFRMNDQTGKSEPIQVNGHNGPLSQAISGCPVGAISLG